MLKKYKVFMEGYKSLFFLGFVVWFILMVSRFRFANLAATFLFLFPFNYWGSVGPVNLNLSEVLIVIIFFLWLSFNITSNRGIKYIKNPFNKWILAYMAISFILLLNSNLYEKATYKAISRSLEFGMLFFILANTSPPEASSGYFKKIINLLLLAMTIVCFFGIAEFIIYNRDFPLSFIHFHQQMISWNIYPPRPLDKIVNLSLEGKTIGSTFASKSALSIYLSVMLPLVFLKMVFAKKAVYKTGLVFIFLLGLFCLFLTGSRMGVTAFLSGILIIFLILRTRKIFSIMAGLVLGIMIFSYFLPQDFQERLLFKTHQSSFFGRKTYMQRSLNIIKNNFLFGAGIDSLGGERQESKPHSAFLAEFQTKGVFAFLVFLGLFLSAIREFFRNLSLTNKPYISDEIKIMSFWSFISIAEYFIITCFAAEPFYENQTSVLFLLALAIAVNLKIINNEFKHPAA